MDRHKVSAAMLTYLFEGGFTGDEIRELLEDYFLGIVPPEVNRVSER